VWKQVTPGNCTRAAAAATGLKSPMNDMRTKFARRVLPLSGPTPDDHNDLWPALIGSITTTSIASIAWAPLNHAVEGR
jgi:hypothetical protein